MKKQAMIYALLLLALSSCLLLAGCDEKGGTTTNTTVAINPDYDGSGLLDLLPEDDGVEEYAGVRRGMTYEEVVALLGEEPAEAPLGQAGEKCWVLEDGTRLYLRFQTLLHVSSETPEVNTKTVVSHIRVVTE
ncbi:MAG: hypothetical protein IKY29_02975 [Clostridia bacterium]|nr:hypothetical protein [Clostridia bacterium]